MARKFSIERIYVCAGGLDILKSDKTLLIYSGSYFNLGGLEHCLVGLSGNWTDLIRVSSCNAGYNFLYLGKR